MWQRVKRSLSFSNVVAVVALFFALGGTVYAAAGKISGAQIKPSSIPANRIKPKSLTATQLKAGAVSAAQIKAGSIPAGKIQSGSLTGTQIKAESLTGTQIKSGSLTGTQIKSGSLTGTQVLGSSLTGVSAAAVGTVQYVTSTVPLNPALTKGTSTSANCPGGMKVIGGGATVSNSEFSFINESAPASSRTGWSAVGFGETGVTMTVTAICTPVTTSTG
jgi:hypothetical protein